MSRRLVDRIPFSRIIAVLASIFGVSLGLCGVNAVLIGAAQGSRGFGDALVFTAYSETAAILLSAAGLVVTAAVWIVLTVVSNFTQGGSESQGLFDRRDEDKHD